MKIMHNHCLCILNLLFKLQSIIFGDCVLHCNQSLSGCLLSLLLQLCTISCLTDDDGFHRRISQLIKIYSPVVTIYTASLTFSNSTFYPHSVFMCFVWIWEQTAIISLYNINWLVFITETECVYCAVRSTSYVLPTQRIYIFCVDLRTNSGNFPIQH